MISNFDASLLGEGGFRVLITGQSPFLCIN